MLRHVARWGIRYSLCQRGIRSCRSSHQLHLVSDAMTGALCTAVCEVSAVTHYQRRRMVESIDHVRLYHQFPNLNDGDCFVV
jgi:heterodisulfide reductase subunit C